MDGLLRHPGNYLEATDTITAAVQCLWMKTPRFAAPDRPFENIDWPVVLRWAHREAFWSRSKVKRVHYYSSPAACIDEGLFARPIEASSSATLLAGRRRFFSRNSSSKAPRLSCLSER